MSAKSGRASIATGALSGAGTGAAAGAAFGPWGAAIGAGVGALGGGFAGYMANEADEEDPMAKEERRRAKGMEMFRAAMGRALAARKGRSFGEMVNGAP